MYARTMLLQILLRLYIFTYLYHVPGVSNVLDAPNVPNASSAHNVPSVTNVPDVPDVRNVSNHTKLAH